MLRVANEPFRLDVIMLRVMAPIESECVLPENTKGGSITALLTSLCLTGLESAVWQLTTDNFCFYLQCRLIQTSRQTGGQWYSDTSPFSIPWFYPEKLREP
jgi:hypothetical protein